MKWPQKLVYRKVLRVNLWIYNVLFNFIDLRYICCSICVSECISNVSLPNFNALCMCSIL
jgi:hypothetical protein